MAQLNKRNGKALPKLAMFYTMAQMSAQCKIPLSILRRAAKEGCAFVRNGRCDLATFNEWFFSAASGKGDDREEDWAKFDKKQAGLIKEEKLMQMRRQTIQYAIVTDYLNALVHQIFFGELARIAQEFPPNLKGRSEVEIEGEVLRQIELVKKQLTGKLAEWVKLGNVPDTE